MISKDDLVQQLLELDAEIAAAEERRRWEEKEAQIWASSNHDSEPGVMSGSDSTAIRAIGRLREQREVLTRQIKALPEPE